MPTISIHITDNTNVILDPDYDYVTAHQNAFHNAFGKYFYPQESYITTLWREHDLLFNTFFTLAYAAFVYYLLYKDEKLKQYVTYIKENVTAKMVLDFLVGLMIAIIFHEIKLYFGWVDSRYDFWWVPPQIGQYIRYKIKQTDMWKALKELATRDYEPHVELEFVEESEEEFEEYYDDEEDELLFNFDE